MDFDPSRRAKRFGFICVGPFVGVTVISGRWRGSDAADVCGGSAGSDEAATSCQRQEFLLDFRCGAIIAGSDSWRRSGESFALAAVVLPDGHPLRNGVDCAGTDKTGDAEWPELFADHCGRRCDGACRNRVPARTRPRPFRHGFTAIQGCGVPGADVDLSGNGGSGLFGTVSLPACSHGIVADPGSGLRPAAFLHGRQHGSILVFALFASLHQYLAVEHRRRDRGVLLCRRRASRRDATGPETFSGLFDRIRNGPGADSGLLSGITGDLRRYLAGALAWRFQSVAVHQQP